MKKLTLSGILVGVASVAFATPGLAYDYECDWEPPVTVVTPAGHHVTINNFLSAPRQYRHLLLKAKATGTAESDGHDGTLVTIQIWLPSGGAEHVHVRATTARFQVTEHTDANWGGVTSIQVRLPIT